MAWRPRSAVVKKRAEESGAQVKLLTQRSSVSVRLVTLPVVRSRTMRRKRSLSYPPRTWERHARYLPSGEYCGLRSPPAVEVILRDSPPWMETTNRSELVLMAGTG